MGYGSLDKQDDRYRNRQRPQPFPLVGTGSGCDSAINMHTSSLQLLSSPSLLAVANYVKCSELLNNDSNFASSTAVECYESDGYSISTNRDRIRSLVWFSQIRASWLRCRATLPWWKWPQRISYCMSFTSTPHRFNREAKNDSQQQQIAMVNASIEFLFCEVPFWCKKITCWRTQLRYPGICGESNLQSKIVVQQSSCGGSDISLELECPFYPRSSCKTQILVSGALQLSYQ